MSYQEHAEHFEHQRELVAAEDDRRRGHWDAPLAADEFPWIEEDEAAEVGHADL